MKESGLRVFGEPYGILVESRQIPLMGVTWGGGTKERRNGGKGTRMPECSVSLFLDDLPPAPEPPSSPLSPPPTTAASANFSWYLSYTRCLIFMSQVPKSSGGKLRVLGAAKQRVEGLAWSEAESPGKVALGNRLKERHEE